MKRKTLGIILICFILLSNTAFAAENNSLHTVPQTTGHSESTTGTFYPIATVAAVSSFSIDAGSITVSPGNRAGEWVVTQNGTKTVVDSDIHITGSDTSADCNIVVEEQVTADIILDGVHIITPHSVPPIALGNGSRVTLTVVGNNTLTAGSNACGIYVHQTAVLTIRGDGTLEAAGGENGAGIGSSRGDDCGSIIIEGGTVMASGGGHSAGIGGGFFGDAGNITILNGEVTAIGGEWGAGIGGGNSGAGGNILIQGGTVKANGGEHASGIGGGFSGVGGDITITGGVVTATGGTNGAGLRSTGGQLLIADGTVTASGGESGAGIGGSSYEAGGNITISGGTVAASGGQNASGIGGGIQEEGGKITITGGAVTATGGDYGAGIGGGKEGAGGSILIQGGTVVATSSHAGAGIGGGQKGHGGIVAIEGGTVVATGGTAGSGVGGGNGGDGGENTITGGSVIANSVHQTATNGTESGNEPVYVVHVPFHPQVAGTVENISLLRDGNTYPYGKPDTVQNGAFLFWLPIGTYTGSITMDGVTYLLQFSCVSTDDGTVNQATVSYSTPSAKIDYLQEQLTGLAADVSYTINGVEQAADAAGRIDIDPVWLGTELFIQQPASKSIEDSAIQELAIPARPPAPSGIQVKPTATSLTVTLPDGTGACEFSLDGIIWQTSSSFTGLIPETTYTVYVRGKATASSFVTEQAIFRVTLPANVHQVTFETGTGSPIYTDMVSHGEKAVPPTSPTQTGYTFHGWYQDAACTIEWDFEHDMITEDVVLHAKWTINQYTITFDTDGGSQVASITQNYGTAITKLANPTKEGYSFAGWDKAIPATMPAQNLTLTAQWTPKQYSITFDTDGGSQIASITQDYGTAITKPANPTKEGYSFAGWDRAIPATMPAENLTLTAQWTPKQYTITFDTDGGSHVASITQDYGTAITKLANPTKEGYSFAGWDKAIPATMPAENLTLTAQWSSGQYTITFDTDGGSQVAPITQDYGTAITKPDNPAKEGYTFAGWDKVIPATMPAQNLTLTAQWTSGQYTITFDTDGGSQVAPITQDYGTTVTTPANPTKEGYSFAGWDKAIPATMPAQNLTLTAQWTPKQYTITFDTDGGSQVAPITQDYGTAITKPANPTREGYSFAGWDRAVPATMPAQNLTLTAQWTSGQYTITFDTDGGSQVAPITQDYGTTVTTPANPTKEGYSFAGWDKAIPATMPAQNLTITAQWTPKQYIITFDTDGGNQVAPITQDYGAAITKPDNPAKKGYTFAGWDKVIPATMPAQNLTITAQWTPKQYTITFDTDGGSQIASITQDYGTALTKPANPTREGYSFAGWDRAVPATMPAQNLTLTAQWTSGQYTITFDTDGGSQVAPITQDYGTTVTTPANPTKEGYTFTGWDKVIPATMPAQNFTLTAQWTPNRYTITFDTDGGSQVAPITQDYGTAITKPANPTKEGYTFAGWYQDVNHTKTWNANIITKDITLYARWKQTVTGDDGGTSNNNTSFAEILTVPLSVNENIIQVTAIADGYTAVIQSVSLSLLQNLAEGYVDAVMITIDFSGLSQNIHTMSILTEIFRQMVQSFGHNLSLRIIFSNGASIVLDAIALNEAISDIHTYYLSVSLQNEHLDQLPRDTVGVWQPVLSVDDRAISRSIGKITLYIPCELQNGEHHHGIVVWHVAEDGSRQWHQVSYDSDTKQVSWSTTVFALHMIGYDRTLRSNPFSDVQEGSYYYDAVLWATRQNITHGVTETTFSPDQSCTRAQMATFLWRAMGSPEPVGNQKPFTDVPADAYYAKAVQWAYEQKITGGTSATTFSPDEACTRSQMTVFLWRTAGSPTMEDTSSPFADVPEGVYYGTAVQWAYESGITGGTGSTAFSPDATCTRGQMMTFLYRYLGI